MAENAPLRRHRPAREKICVRLEGVERGSRRRALGKLPAGPPAYPPLGGRVILGGSPAADSYFPRFIAADGARLGPFGAEIAAWLGRQGAGAALSGA